MILIAGSMICSILSSIPRSFLSRGIGYGATRVLAQRGSTVVLRRLIVQSTGVEKFLDELRGSLKDRSFRPLPVRERMIPKAGGKLRRLGIAAVTDRVVQASLKLVLEPIFEADFLPCSYGFRPNRRAHDAVAEVRFLASHSYEWIVEGDIKACFDEISHSALLDRVRNAYRRQDASWRLVKAFLKAGILGEDRVLRREPTPAPHKGSIFSPLLSQRGPLGAGRAHRPCVRAAPPPRLINGHADGLEVCPNYQSDALCGRLVPDHGIRHRADAAEAAGAGRRPSCPRWDCACRRRRP